MLRYSLILVCAIKFSCAAHPNEPRTDPGAKRDVLADHLVVEARTMAQLNHPHTVAIYDVAEYDGRVC